ncbi:hypothetical protein OPQ81_011009 [Rhizoctonia solani]|nr:hypothetical protein OPQ81_011009 [Rhizoctonia solani]
MSTGIPPTVNGPTCPQTCLAQAASSMGCGNSNNLECICRGIESYILNAGSCMQNQPCEPALSSQAIRDARAACSLVQSPGPSSSSSSQSSETGPGSIGPPTDPTRTPTATPTPTSTPTPSPTPTPPTPTPTPTPRTPTPSPSLTEPPLKPPAASSTTRRLVTTTQTQTLVLTPGEIVTLGVSGTVLTTFTASSSLTTTRVATMLQQDGGGGGGFGGDSGGPGSGNGAVKLRTGHRLGGVIGVVGLFLGGVMVL